MKYMVSPFTVIEVMDLLRSHIAAGNILPVTQGEVTDALSTRMAFTAEGHGMVVGFIMIKEFDDYLKIGPIAVSEMYDHAGLGSWLLEQVIENYGQCQKPLIAIANPQSLKLFLNHGFSVGDKQTVPQESRGGRSEQEWQNCDRTYVYLQTNPFP
jgi:N-acetylglutamate synthase-like GNAT family acetyltransferase